MKNFQIFKIKKLKNFTKKGFPTRFFSQFFFLIN